MLVATVIITALFLVIALLLLLILIGFFFYLFDTFLELPYVATKKNTVSAIISLSNLKKGETVVDLGSGDGRLLFAAAGKGAFAIGYELNPMLVVVTILRAKLKGLSSQIRVHQTNLWKADLKVADVIFVYARYGTMQKMQDFVYKNAKKGSRVIVNTDLTKPFPTKKPFKTNEGAYLYKV